MQACSFLSFAGVVLVIALIFAPRPVVAGWPSKMGKQDKDQMQDILDGRLAIPAELALFVKYKNAEGRQIAKRYAVNKEFKTHEKKLKVVSILVKKRKALNALLSNPNIEYVEPQHRIHALSQVENKTHNYHVQGTQEVHDLDESVGYGVKMVQADKMWDVPPPKEKMTICIIDSGYGLGHPDLPDLDTNVTGKSTGAGDWREDVYGHGTHCAGVIGAIGDNDIGISGVLKDPDRFQFHIGKSLDNAGDGSEVDMLIALESCIDAGAKVISMSLGSEGYSQTLNDACKDAYDKNILLVAAAGNAGGTKHMYPASYPQVMSVAAVDKDGKVTSFSQYNDQVEIAGPGVDIVSTSTSENGQSFVYSPWSGTSMATPFVTGVAAVVWSYFPECTNNQIRNVLIRTAKREENYGCTDDVGFGIVQAKDAYNLLVKEGCIAGDVSPVPLSDGGVGGCAQDPLYTQPPTPAPTPFKCREKIFALKLNTDEYAEETSWELTNSNNEVVASGKGYRNKEAYRKRLCLPPDEYTFNIRDSEGDGICCNFGAGGYSINYDGQLVKEGGNFADKDVATFGEINSQTAKLPTDALCADDPGWIFITGTGKRKRCKYVEALPSRRCVIEGVDRKGNPVTGYEACPRACSRCTAPENGQPKKPLDARTASPTTQPSSSPTAYPTPFPTRIPTRNPTEVPTTPPTAQPSKFPTAYPTPFPTWIPTPNPTETPTVPPTPQPSKAPTSYPSKVSTPRPTIFPTESPTIPPTPKPSSPPTKSPTASPTPSPSPTSWPTREPTPVPTIPPTQVCFSDMRENGDYSYPCKFPHEYRNQTYYSCTDDHWRGRWCRHENGKDWGICENSAACLNIESPTQNDPPSVEERYICKDDPDFLRTNEYNITRDCDGIGSSPAELCIFEGIGGSGKRVFANVSCPVMCNTCPEGSVIECRNDGLWGVGNKGSTKHCDWVANDPQGRCDLEGRNRQRKKSLAKDSCPLSCNSCPRGTVIVS